MYAYSVAVSIELSEQERAQLQSWARRHVLPGAPQRATYGYRRAAT